VGDEQLAGQVFEEIKKQDIDFDKSPSSFVGAFCVDDAGMRPFTANKMPQKKGCTGTPLYI
jgi:hypothetical protein